MVNDLIKATLELIRDVLETGLQNAAPRTRPWVSLSNVLDHRGQPWDEADRKLVLFLANITRENIISTYRPTVPSADGRSFTAVPPPIHVNLNLLCYANFANNHYSEGLGVISWVLSFFQQNPVFTHESQPDLDPKITQLTFDLISLDATQLNYLMGLVGTRYLPSAYYKIRLLTFDGEAIRAEVPAVQGLEGSGEPDIEEHS